MNLCTVQRVSTGWQRAGEKLPENSGNNLIQSSKLSQQVDFTSLRARQTLPPSSVFSPRGWHHACHSRHFHFRPPPQELTQIEKSNRNETERTEPRHSTPRTQAGSYDGEQAEAPRGGIVEQREVRLEPRYGKVEREQQHRHYVLDQLHDAHVQASKRTK